MSLLQFSRSVPADTTPSSPGDTAIPAFPGAEGFGARSKGGRGGRAVYVTTLEDYNRRLGERLIKGSLRYAVEELKGPRTVLFQSGGTIFLKAGLILNGEPGSFVTLAGQSAPGDGIQLAGYGLTISNGAHDVIVQHLRIRPGVTHLDRWRDPDGAGPLPPYLEKWDTDALTLFGHPGRVVRDVIVDHCSLEWAIDENAGICDDVERITFQHCIFAEGSTFGHYGHPQSYPYPHSCGFVAGADVRRASDAYLTLHHNLFMSNVSRNPLVAANGSTIEFINNVLYNCRSEPFRLGSMQNAAVPGGPRVNIIGNRYLWGPEDTNRRRRMVSLQTADGAGTRAVEDRTIYLRDNLDPYRQDSRIDELEVVSDGRVHDRKAGDANHSLLARKQRPSPWPSSGVGVTVQSAESILDTIKRNCGASHPRHDPVDARLMRELATGGGRSGFGGADAYDRHPKLDPGRPVLDSDADGMPDAYEQRHGLNPAGPADGSKDPDGKGYTNLERYLHTLVGPSAPAGE